MESRKRAVLVVSFGTSHKETRAKTIEAIEADIRRAFTGYEVRRAFTSPTIIRMIQEREGVWTDDTEQALERLLNDGFRHVIVQPTHIIHGFEYDKIAACVERYRDRFAFLALGKPLLSEEDDYRQTARTLAEELSDYRQTGSRIVLVGHGTDHEAHTSYQRFAGTIAACGLGDFSVGTVEQGETKEPESACIARDGSLFSDAGVSRIVLVPLLVVAGMHAARDIFGSGGESWKSRFERAGYPVESVMRGLGEYAGIRRIYIRHAKEAEASENPLLKRQNAQK